MEYLNAEFAKKHWQAIGAGLFGSLVLYYLYEHFKGGPSAGASASGDLSGGSTAVTNLSAAASLQNAQINGQVEIAQLQTSAAVKAAEIQAGVVSTVTAAQLEATNLQTAAAVTIATGAQQEGISIQDLQSKQAVEQTRIYGKTLEDLAITSSSVVKQQLQLVGSQVQAMMAGSKHFSTDIRNFAPVIASELGQAGAAASLGQTAGNVAVQTSVGAQVGAILNPLAKLTSGLFGLFG